MVSILTTLQVEGSEVLPAGSMPSMW